MVEDIDLRILRKFELVQKLGKGAYGVVYKAIDRKQKQLVALKKVLDAFHNRIDAKRTFREVMYLTKIDHPNVIRLNDVIKAENEKDLYLIFEFMESDLHSVIRANVLLEPQKRYVLYQILKALKYLHSGELVHRDIKPSNILMNVDCIVKIADFGLARSLLIQESDVASEPMYTEYVATRWYRAPELLLGAYRVSKATDMWSVGCILGEMILGKAVFPGTSTLNQIERIMDLLGKPKPEEIQSIGPVAENIVNSINVSKRKSFQVFFPNAGEDAIDLLSKLLAFRPEARLTVEEALKHRYVKEFVNPEKEVSCESPILIQFQQEDRETEVNEYRDALYTFVRKQRKWKERKELKNQGVAKDLLIESSFLKEELKESEKYVGNNPAGLSKSMLAMYKNPGMNLYSKEKSDLRENSIGGSKESSALLREGGKTIGGEVKSGQVMFASSGPKIKQAKSNSMTKMDLGREKKKSNFLIQSPILAGIVKKFKKKNVEDTEKGD